MNLNVHMSLRVKNIHYCIVENGLHWVEVDMHWIGLGLKKVTHLHLCAGAGRTDAMGQHTAATTVFHLMVLRCVSQADIRFVASAWSFVVLFFQSTRGFVTRAEPYENSYIHACWKSQRPCAQCNDGAVLDPQHRRDST
jgi:hypothetical protein